jgi:mRNA interferase MazF
MVIGQGEVWWAELDEPNGSAPGLRRPVIVAQCNALNQSRVGTVVCVPLTSNLKWSDAPGNVLLTAASSGLPKDCVANVSLLIALDKRQLTERAGRITRRQLELIFSGIDIVLGR